MAKKRTFYLSLLGIFTGLLLWSCGKDNTGRGGMLYHNTTARYNAWFLADDKLKVIDDQISAKYEDDYNRILPVFTIPDSNYAKGIKADLDYIVDKSTIPIDKHPHSIWVDDCFTLIGICKLYEHKMDSASHIFKYVHTKSESAQARQLAHIWLMRTYLMNDEMISAKNVFNHLRQKEIDPDNKRIYHEANAQYHLQNSNYRKMLEDIELAIPHIKDKDEKSRIHYIAGQLQQRFGYDSAAYAHYKKALRGNPKYEVEFNSKLNMAQVSKVGNNFTAKKINKTFDKMLVDLKNEEYRDRIYYERGRYELKRGNISKAVRMLNKSLRAQGQTPNQKTYSYLLLGKVFYERVDSLPKVRKYTMSKLYYDSTVASMKEDFEGFEDIVERNRILADFVEQITIVQKEDSLLKWADVPQEELEAAIDKWKARDEQLLKEEQERQKKKAEAAAKSGNVVEDFSSTSNFTLYDPNALARGKIAFLDLWGDRILEDNWRRSTKDFIIKDNEVGDTTAIAALDTASTDTATADTSSQPVEIARDSYLKDIPFTAEAKQSANLRIEDALYQLGKIYHFELKEPFNAVTTYQTYLERFPGTDRGDEVIYLLYLLCPITEMCDKEVYRDKIHKEYPNSIYAKIMDNPNYKVDNQKDNKQARRDYESAYGLYTSGSYLRSRASLDKIASQYPNNDIMDKIMLLKALTFARTDDYKFYKHSLMQFMVDFKTSDLAKYAGELLMKAPNAPKFSAEDTTYIYTPDGPHLLVGSFATKDIEHTEALPIFYEFNDTYFAAENLATKRVDFKLEEFLIAVKTFDGKQAAKTYLDKLVHYNQFRNQLENVEYSYYIISAKNYEVLLSTKNLNGYKSFSKKHY